MTISSHIFRLVIGACAGAVAFPFIAFFVMGMGFGFDQVGLKQLFPPLVVGGVTIGLATLLFSRNRSLALQKLELELERRLAESANEAKSRFLTSMSHELRTPMNSILGFAQLLDQDPSNPLSDAQKEQVRYILEGGDHLLKLIDRILDLAKIEAGNIQAVSESVDPASIINECLQMLTPQAAKNRITIENVTLPSALPALWTDPDRLRQILLNLLSNAIKYNREGGKVEVSVTPNLNGFCRMSVFDTGCGIPADKQDDLFVPFSRLGREAGPIEGNGVGLAVCKQLTELLGGHLGFESEENVGTTFWVELPHSV